MHDKFQKRASQAMRWKCASHAGYYVNLASRPSYVPLIKNFMPFVFSRRYPISNANSPKTKSENFLLTSSIIGPSLEVSRFADQSFCMTQKNLVCRYWIRPMKIEISILQSMLESRIDYFFRVFSSMDSDRKVEFR